MPLHGVGIIVGGTIAVVGSGYAFKKFVYDPHLAPYIEAFIAQHPILHSLSPSPTPAPPAETHRTPIPVSATSSARQSHLTHARQRRSVNRKQDADGLDIELEMRQPLLRSGEREEYLLDSDGLDDWGKSRRATMAVPKVDKRKSGRQREHAEASTSHSLVDLAQEPVQPTKDPRSQDWEIRSIVFDRDELSSPTKSPLVHPIATLPAEPQLISTPIHNVIIQRREAIPTMPSPPQSVLSDSWSVDIPIIQSIPPAPPETNRPLPHPVPFDNESDDESAMISRPHTAQSDYIDAESYTPLNDRGASPTFSAFPSLTSSPQRRHRSPPIPEADRPNQAGGVAEMGLSYIRLQNPVQESGSGRGSTMSRSMSVISLSESEGGSDDWEAL